MKISVIGHRKLNRLGSTNGGASVAERLSSDFLIDDESLLRILTKADGGHGDLMGCLVNGLAKHNAEAVAQLILHAKPEIETGHVLIYVCPECGDIGCGAYSVLVERDQETYVWKEFFYENGYEKSRAINDVGPYFFAAEDYEAAIQKAADF